VRGRASIDVTGQQLPSNGKMWRMWRRGLWGRAPSGVVLSAAFVIIVAGGPFDPSAGGAVPAVRTVLAPGTLDSAGAVAIDSAGNVFVADTGHCRVAVIAGGNGRRYGVTLRTGRAVTIAGGHCGGGSLGHPTGLAVDVTGDVYVAEANEQRVKVIEPSGVVANVAGTGAAGDGSDGGVASVAQLNEPMGVAVDHSGDLFIADTANCKVRVVAAASGSVLGHAVVRDHIYTVAGTGVCGSAGQGGPIGGAQLFDPVAVAIDFAGDLLVADRGDQSVLLATASGGTYYGTAVASGDIGVVAGGTGNYGPYLTDGLSATGVGAELNDLRDIALGPTGALVLADGFMHVIRVVPAQSGPLFGRAMTAGDLYTVAGALPVQTAGGAGDATRWVVTRMGTPTGVAITKSGSVFYSDSATGAVVRVG
jgi:sugar lactone lactonase YvrE